MITSENLTILPIQTNSSELFFIHEQVTINTSTYWLCAWNAKHRVTVIDSGLLGTILLSLFISFENKQLTYHNNRTYPSVLLVWDDSIWTVLSETIEINRITALNADYRIKFHHEPNWNESKKRKKWSLKFFWLSFEYWYFVVFFFFSRMVLFSFFMENGCNQWTKTDNGDKYGKVKIYNQFGKVQMDENIVI